MYLLGCLGLWRSKSITALIKKLLLFFSSFSSQDFIPMRKPPKLGNNNVMFPSTVQSFTHHLMKVFPFSISSFPTNIRLFRYRELLIIESFRMLEREVIEHLFVWRMFCIVT